MASVMRREWKTRTGETKVGWQVQYFVNGMKRRRQFPTERKAKKFVETIGSVRETDLKSLAAGVSPTVETFAYQWLRQRELGTDGNPPLDPETVVWYRGLIANHISPALGRVPVAALTRDQVREFREHLLQGAMSRRTAAKILTALRTILGAAVEEGSALTNVSDRLPIRHSRREVAEVEIHTIAEMRSLLAAARTSLDRSARRRGSMWPQWYPILLLSVYAGLRFSEIRGLDCKNVDLTRQVVRVRQRADKRGRLGAPKSRQGNREVHVPKVVVDALAPVVQAKVEGLVFTSRSGHPIDPANFRKRCWEHVQRAAGVRVLTLHSCRHFFASRQIADGVNPKELASLLGHADEAFTLRTYGHLFKDAETEARRLKRAEALVLA
jgi:integrase